MIIDPELQSFLKAVRAKQKKEDFTIIYKKFGEAWKKKDMEAYLDCYHADWQIIFHSTGKVMRLEELSD